jgi:hypothetical protein
MRDASSAFAVRNAMVTLTSRCPDIISTHSPVGADRGYSTPARSPAGDRCTELAAARFGGPPGDPSVGRGLGGGSAPLVDVEQPTK